MKLEIKPYKNGNFSIERTNQQKIDVTCKDSKIKPEYLVQESKEIVFVGSLSECEILIKENNK